MTLRHLLHQNRYRLKPKSNNKMIFVSDSAKEKIESLRGRSNITSEHFIRVSVISGGCSGLSYKMDFDTEEREKDQVFER